MGDMAGKLKDNDIVNDHINHRLDRKVMLPVSRYPKFLQKAQTSLSSLHPAQQ